MLFHQAMARKHDQAHKILDRLRKHQTFQVAFTYTRQEVNKEAIHEQTHEGALVVKGNQFRWVLEEQEVINNGVTVWTYLRAANEVQIADPDPEQTKMLPWMIFANYQQNYTIQSFQIRQVQDNAYDVICLMAKKKEQAMQEITLTIERKTGHIQCLAMRDCSQTFHRFHSTHFDYDIPLEEDFFSFHPEHYKGIEVIDLRE